MSDSVLTVAIVAIVAIVGIIALISFHKDVSVNMKKKKSDKLNENEIAMTAEDKKTKK